MGITLGPITRVEIGGHDVTGFVTKVVFNHAVEQVKDERRWGDRCRQTCDHAADPLSLSRTELPRSEALARRALQRRVAHG